MPRRRKTTPPDAAARTRKLEQMRILNAAGYVSIAELTRAVNRRRRGRSHVSRQFVSATLGDPTKGPTIRAEIAAACGVDERTLWPDLDTVVRRAS